MQTVTAWLLAHRRSPSVGSSRSSDRRLASTGGRHTVARMEGGQRAPSRHLFTASPDPGVVTGGRTMVSSYLGDAGVPRDGPNAGNGKEPNAWVDDRSIRIDPVRC